MHLFVVAALALLRVDWKFPHLLVYYGKDFFLPAVLAYSQQDLQIERLFGVPCLVKIGKPRLSLLLDAVPALLLAVDERLSQQPWLVLLLLSQQRAVQRYLRIVEASIYLYGAAADGLALAIDVGCHQVGIL